MTLGHVAQLFILGAIWGGSFIYMRILVPPFGAVLTATGRTLVAGLALTVWVLATRHKMRWRRYWRHYLFVALINSALPFVLFGFAANYIPASYSATLNSTTPLFGAILSAIWLSEPLTLARIGGIGLGTAGVAAVAGIGTPGDASSLVAWSVAACVVASFGHAAAAVYVQREMAEADPIGLTAATQLAAGAMLFPLLEAAPPLAPFTPTLTFHLVSFGLLCSAVAFLIYFHLIATIGTTRTLTVTFLMPLFGMIFGVIFLAEAITMQMIVGCALVLGGTMLVLGKPQAP